MINEIDDILNSRPDVEISLLPGPSWLKAPEGERFGRILKFGRTADPHVIAEFLAKGNMFWYSLPDGYMDMGPRVILEAMAAGLPVIADAWGGAVDRVTPETGFLCTNKKQFVEVIQSISSEELRKKGEAAKERARSEFVPNRWLVELLT